jgi:hypothetical protein
MFQSVLSELCGFFFALSALRAFSAEFAKKSRRDRQVKVQLSAILFGGSISPQKAGAA